MANTLLFVVVAACVLVAIYLYTERSTSPPNWTGIQFKISENIGTECLDHTNNKGIISSLCKNVSRDWMMAGKQLLHIPSGGCLTVSTNSIGTGECTGAPNQSWGRLSTANEHDRHLQVQSTGQCLTSSSKGLYMSDCSSNPYQAFIMTV